MLINKNSYHRVIKFLNNKAAAMNLSEREAILCGSDFLEYDFELDDLQLDLNLKLRTSSKSK